MFDITFGLSLKAKILDLGFDFGLEPWFCSQMLGLGVQGLGLEL